MNQNSKNAKYLRSDYVSKTKIKKPFPTKPAITKNVSLSVSSKKSVISKPIKKVSPIASVITKTTIAKKKITVPESKHVSNGVQLMKKHVMQRVNELSQKLQTNKSLIVTIAGTKSEGSKLGKHRARGQWLSKGYTIAQYDEFITFLDSQLNNLKRNFPKRVSFGFIAEKNASANHYQVWGANARNWNLKNGNIIPGEGQARAVNRQIPGVFGIVTTPINGIP